MEASDLAFAGIARQAELVRAGELSARELVETCLARIERLDPQLNAFRIVLAERALAEADQAQARLRAGDERPLLGVPVAIKDNVDVAGELTTHGTRAHGGPVTEDAEIVRRLREAGAIVIGKTHLPELAIWGFTESATWGMTRNPWAPERTPGGSSGGSAAAVAAGMVGAGHASDGAGSIRIPAACCGLFGLKPQRGRVPLAPLLEHWHGLSVNGVVTRTVRDTALFLDVTSGAAPGGAPSPPAPKRSFAEFTATPPGRLRIAVSSKPSLKPSVLGRVDDAVIRPLMNTADLLRSLGHQVSEQDPDWGTLGNNVTTRYLRGIHDDVVAMPHPRRLERRTRGMSRFGRLISPALLRKALADEQRHAARVRALFDDYDVLMTPVLSQPPVEVGRWEGRGALATLTGLATSFAGAFTSPWNALGQPAAAVPVGIDPDGLPQSVQLVGRPNDEATLLSLAAQLEAETNWPKNRPPVD